MEDKLSWVYNGINITKVLVRTMKRMLQSSALPPKSVECSGPAQNAIAKPRQDNATDTSATSIPLNELIAPLVFEADGAAEPEEAVPDAVLDPDWAALPAVPVDDAAADDDAEPVADPVADDDAATLEEPVPVTPASV